MGFEFRDVYDFQEQYRTKKARENKLLSMDYDEIMHLAGSCGCAAGAVYYERFAWLAADRSLGLEGLKV